MRFRLLHYTSFVPIVSRIIVDPIGLKMCWSMYLFFTYLLLERHCWNGHPLKTWLNLQRAAESCMVLSLSVARVSPWLSPLVWLTMKYPKRPWLVYGLCCCTLFEHNLFGMWCVGGMIMAEYSPEYKKWSLSALRRVVVSMVQLAAMLTAFQTEYHRMVIVVFMVVLKSVHFMPKDDTSMESEWDGQTPTTLSLNIKPHTI